MVGKCALFKRLFDCLICSTTAFVTSSAHSFYRRQGRMASLLWVTAAARGVTVGPERPTYSTT
jgi:hypothetical protein